MTVVHFNLYDPTNGVFKSRACEKAQIQYVECSCTDCPLLKRGECAATRFLGRCVYGRFRREEGYTKRANNYRKWIAEKRQEFNGVPYLKPATPKMAFIGDYVFLPYAHMNHCDGPAKFTDPSGIFSLGLDFLHKDHWILSTVISLIDFRPRALIGGEIASYQKESIPLFLQHLREVDPAMWEQLVKERPELNKEPNYVGRITKLKTLNYPIDVEIKGLKYEWNGKELVCREIKALSWDYRDSVESCEIRMIPKENAEITVQDNGWVNKNTEFIN